MKTRKSGFTVQGNLPWKLQWGRVGEDAEMETLRGAWVGCELLQWGRVGEDAEMAILPSTSRQVRQLQWGRVGEDAEILESLLVVVEHGPLQWGRVGEDAEIRHAGHRPESGGCFNGAASVKTRKSA